MSTEYKISRPYARAVFELAQEQGTLAQWSEMLNTTKAIVENKAMQQVLKNPEVSKEEQIEMIISLGQGRFTEEVKNLIRALAKFKRLAFLPQIAEQFDVLRCEAEAVVNVEITSAFPLVEQDKSLFMEALKKRLKRDIKLDCKSDPTLLAGAIIRAGDLLIDGSLRGKLAKLADAVGIYR